MLQAIVYTIRIHSPGAADWSVDWIDKKSHISH